MLRVLSRPVFMGLAVALIAAVAAPAEDDPAFRDGNLPAPGRVKIMPAADVTRGMTGYGLTVFQGHRVEKFDIEIIDVVPAFIYPKQSIILARCSHPLLDKAKIISGMSGSPIYVMKDGEPHLIGALAYGWGFQVDSICGITPIEMMLSELDRFVRRQAKRQDKKTASAPSQAPAAKLTATRAAPRLVPWERYREELAHQGVRTDRDILRALFQRGRRIGTRGGGMWRGHELRPLRAPLMISGSGGWLTERMKSLLGEFGFLAVPLGGGKAIGRDDSGNPRSATRNARLVPGSAIGVQLMTGDSDWTGVGTVTYVDERGVLAFGHPMFGYAGAGDIEAPITTADVHTIIASRSMSFKLSSSGAQVGALQRDSMSCIISRLGQAPRMVPVHVSINGAIDGKKSSFSFKTLRHKQFTQFLALFALWDSLDVAEPSMDDTTLRVRQTIKIEGHEPLELSDVYASVGPFAFGILQPLRALAAWPWEDLYIERLDYHVDVHSERRTAQIETLRCNRIEVRAGETVDLHVIVRPFADKRRTIRMPFLVPADTLAGALSITVSGGNFAMPDLAPPDTVDDLLRNIKRKYKSTDLVLSFARPTLGIRHRGRILPRLPASVLNVLSVAANDTERLLVTGDTSQQVMATEWVLFGKQSLTLKVLKRAE